MIHKFMSMTLCQKKSFKYVKSANSVFPNVFYGVKCSLKGSELQQKVPQAALLFQRNIIIGQDFAKSFYYLSRV